MQTICETIFLVQARYSDDEDVDDDAQPPAHSKSNSGKNRATKVPKKAMMKPKASSQGEECV